VPPIFFVVVRDAIGVGWDLTVLIVGGVITAVAVVDSPVFMVLLIATSSLFLIFALKKHGAVAVRVGVCFYGSITIRY